MSQENVNEQAPETQAPVEDPKAAEKAAKKAKKEQADAEKASKKAEKEAAKAKADAEKAAAKVTMEKDSRNGITRPAKGVTQLVWSTADSMSKELGNAVERAPLVEALKGRVEIGTVHTQYGRWRKYYGLTETKEARQARLKVIRDEKDAEKASKKAEKEAAKAKAAAEAAEKATQEAAAKVAESSVPQQVVAEVTQ